MWTIPSMATVVSSYPPIPPLPLVRTGSGGGGRTDGGGPRRSSVRGKGPRTSTMTTATTFTTSPNPARMTTGILLIWKDG